MEGEVEIKELKKKYFISLYLVQTWHENTHHARHNEAKTFYEIAFWIFPPLFSQDLFPALFLINYEWKSFDRKKKKSREIKGLIRIIEMRLQNGYDPIVPRDFLQKRHLRQSHCKMSIPTFVQTVVLFSSNIRPVI